MSMTQGYIVGQPLLRPSDWPVEQVVPDTEAAIGPSTTAGSVTVTVARSSAETVQPLYLPSWRGRESGAAWCREYFGALRTLARSLPKFASLTVTFRSGMSFFDQVAPVLLLARFYGVTTVLRYRSNKAEAELEEYGRGILPFLRLASRIEVASMYQSAAFGRFGLTAVAVPDRIDPSLFPHRTITSVQPKIIMARRLIRGNGLAGAIKAFQIVKMKYPRAEMVIAGDGPLRPWLERYVRNERIFGVTFTGQIERTEVARIMKDSDVYLNNAAIDGLPTSLLEALSSGLCVVTTPVGDIPGIINDGRNGLFAEVNNYAAVADRIIELVETPPLCAHLSTCGPRTIAVLSERSVR